MTLRQRSIKNSVKLATYYTVSLALVDTANAFYRKIQYEQEIQYHRLIDKVSRSVFLSYASILILEVSGLLTGFKKLSMLKRAFIGGPIVAIILGFSGYVKEKNNDRGLGKALYDGCTYGLMGLTASCALSSSRLWIGPLFVSLEHLVFRILQNNLATIIRAKYQSPVDVFKNTYGSSTQLKDLKKEVLITSRNLTSNSIYYFSKKNSPDDYVYEVALATSAAPTYFEAREIRKKIFVDGGTDGIHNNPTYLAWHYARVKLNKRKEDVNIISLGTGAHRSTGNLKTTSYPSSLLRQSLFNKYSGEDSHNLISEEFSEDQYIRLQFPLKKDYGLDDILAVESLINEAEDFAKSEAGQLKIKKCASILLFKQHGIRMRGLNSDSNVSVKSFV